MFKNLSDNFWKLKYYGNNEKKFEVDSLRLKLFSVCRVLVGEVNYKINQVDPKKKVQIGSFRVDPEGNQKTHEVGTFFFF